MKNKDSNIKKLLMFFGEKPIHIDRIAKYMYPEYEAENMSRREIQTYRKLTRVVISNLILNKWAVWSYSNSSVVPILYYWLHRCHYDVVVKWKETGKVWPTKTKLTPKNMRHINGRCYLTNAKI